MTDFFAMGGYAAFVWPAWGVALLLLALLAAASIYTLRQQQRLLAKLEDGGA